LRGGLARVRARLGGVLLQEHCHQELEQHQQRFDQGAALAGHLSLGDELPEAPFERVELLSQGLLVGAGQAGRGG